MGYEINWSTTGGAPILRHPLYEKYRLKTLGDIDLGGVQQDLDGVIMDVNAAPIIAYLSWLVRCKQLVA